MLSHFSGFFVFEYVGSNMEKGFMMKAAQLKRTITFFLVLVMVGLSVVSIGAEAPAPAVTPRWTSISHISLDMAFNDENVGTATGTARKKTGASMIEGTIYVYELVDDEWVYIDEAYGSKSVGSLGVYVTFPCESGVTYKTVFTVTAYTNGVGETETVEYVKVCE
jgi:hypothetical protein